VRVRKRLADLIRVIADEAEKNVEFERRLSEVLESSAEPSRGAKPRPKGTGTAIPVRRAKNRRPPAILDPVEIARAGEGPLRAQLSKLTLDQLQDIVADYGMDPGKVVSKWKTTDRVIDRIVELSIVRAHKGNAFRPESSPSGHIDKNE
jgi:hypothetical protein